MNRLLVFLFALISLPALAANRITATVIFTNEVATTNGTLFVVNSSTRTFTNAVVVPSTQVLTNSTAAGSKTNLFNQLALNPVTSISMINLGATNFSLVSAAGVNLTVTFPAWFGSVVYSTQVVATANTRIFPIDANPTAAVRTNDASDMAYALENYSTNSLDQNSVAASELVGLTNTQQITGSKAFYNYTVIFNRSNLFVGGIVSATNISGNAGSITNGLFKTNIFDRPTTTNLVEYGSMNILGYLEVEQLLYFTGAGSWIVSSNSVDMVFHPEGANELTMGLRSGVDGLRAKDAFFTNNLFAGQFYPTNTYARGSTTLAKTNVFPAGSDVSFGLYHLTTLANGNNAAIPVGTNVFVQVSGPSGAFTINGIDGQPNRDGKHLFILNLTGQNMTIAHESGTDPTAANRIYTMTGADIATTGNGVAEFLYNPSSNRWVCVHLQE